MIKYQNRFISILYKLLSIFLSCFVFPLIIITLVTYKYTSNAVKNNVSIANYNLLSQMGDNVNYILNDTHQMSIFLLTDKNLYKLLKASFLDAPELFETKNEILQHLGNIVMNSKYLDYIVIMP